LKKCRFSSWYCSCCASGFTEMPSCHCHLSTTCDEPVPCAAAIFLSRGSPSSLPTPPAPP
jgi:hypothetical protein